MSGEERPSGNEDRTEHEAPEGPATPRRPRTLRPGGARSRPSRPPARDPREGIPGLADRAAQPSAGLATLFPDTLSAVVPMLRRALLDQPLEQAVRLFVSELARALGPATAQVWLAAPGPWMGAGERGGGGNLSPSLRLAARASAPEAAPPGHAPADAGCPTIVAEVQVARRPLVVLDASAHPWSANWAVSHAPGAAMEAPPATLAAYPLTVHEQFLGVLALGAANRLPPRQLAQIEALADFLALAVDREHLLSYSRSQEALAQTVVRHAPVAMAVLTGPEYTVALCNPAFAVLLDLGSAAEMMGRRLGAVVPEWGGRVAESLRLDATRARGEAQALVELPIAHAQGIRYWNVTTSPLPLALPSSQEATAASPASGVLVAAIEVTRQVAARHTAEESAAVARERISQMMTLHATSLAVAGQLGADPRALLADILRRSILLLHARAGVIYARDTHHDELQVMLSQGLRADYTGLRLRLGEGFAGQVARSGRGRIVDDLHAYPAHVAMYENEPFRAVISVPLVAHGRVIGVLDVLDDAEQRIFTQDDLWLLDLFASQAAQAMENARTFVELERAYQQQRELDRLKDDFIATASHELRSPLTGVQGFLDLLLEYSGSRDEPLALDFLRRASASAAELGEIADRLLQTSRLDAGRLDLDIDAVPLAPLVDDVARSLTALHAAQGEPREVRVDVAPNLLVRADAGRLREIVENLLGNALKYSAPAGEVAISAVPAATLLAAAVGGERQLADQESRGGAEETRDRLTALAEAPTLDLPHLGAQPDAANVPAEAVRIAAETEPYLVLLVSDRGMGIGEEEVGRLFGRFSRTDAARTSEIRGTGLGLYICRQLARAMSGDVWLHTSAPGQGSTFALALPLVTSATHDDTDFSQHPTLPPRYDGRDE